MRALVLGLATLALSAGAASAQQAVYPRYGYAPFGYGYAHGYGYYGIIIATIIATTATILATTTIATGIATKRNFEVASTSGLLSFSVVGSSHSPRLTAAQ